LWQQPGGVAYQTLQRWAGQPPAEPDPAEVVRRYRRAFGPAAPADLTAWSGTTGARALFASLGDELRSHTDEQGRALVDLDGLPLADSDEPTGATGSPPSRRRGSGGWASTAGWDPRCSSTACSRGCGG
ncbi:MAG: hypothetical protein HOQ22_13355, partial [Nocardioidaceae bacterium]|nr:hypothetical protein [Nocardioidaceae bacterium]